MIGVTNTLTMLVMALMLGQPMAHPGHSLDQEIAERSTYLKHTKKDLSHCAAKMKARGIEERALQRRAAAIQGLRKAKKAKRQEPHASHQGSNGHGEGQQGPHHQPEPSPKPHPPLHHQASSHSQQPSSAPVNSSPSSYSEPASSSETSAVATSIISTSSVYVSTSSTLLTSVSSSVVAAESTGAAASGSAPSGGAPSGGSNGTMPSGTSSGNSTGGAGQLASSISTFGEEVVDTSHLSNLTVTPTESGVEEIIFGNHTCILNPEGEVGPFYVTGELIRKDIVETQEGVPLTVDGQFIDINTCEPIVDLYWDLWHANSTGVYGGVIGNGNGNSADTGNLNNTFLRGLQPTDTDGVAQFETLFPGHYAGRATHIHVVTHIGGTVLSNGTYTGGNITHIGQLFFDQDLITEVNDNYTPYSTNTIAIVDNDEDRVFAEETLLDSDPVFDYVLLGDDVSDGLFAWITMGIDPTAAYAASAAAYYGEDGGVLE